MASKELIVKIKGDNSDFKKSMNEVSAQTSTINDKFKTVGAALGKVAIAAGVAYGAFQAGKAIINSSSDASDRLEKVTAGLTSGFQQLSRNLVTLNFDNFIGSVNEAIEVGKELADRLDDLQDRTRSLNILESEYGSRIADLRLEASYETNTLTFRIAKMQEAIDLQKELNQKQLDNGKIAKDIAMARLVQETKLSEEQITSFLRQYNNQETLRNQAKIWIDEYKANVNIAGKETVENLIERYKKGFRGLSKGPLFESNALVEAYARNLMQYGEAADNTINAAVDSLVMFNRIAAQGSQTLKGMQRQLNGLTPAVVVKEKGIAGGGIQGSLPDTFTPQFKKIQAAAELNRKFLFQAILEPWKEILTQINDMGAGVSVSITGTFSEINGQMVADLGAIREVVINLNQAFSELAAGAVTSLADSLGSAFSGNGGLKAGLDSILLMFADWAGNLGKIIIASAIAIDGIKKFALNNPWAAVALGVALVATASAIKGTVGQKPVGKGGGGGGSTSQNQDWDAFGLRGIRGMTVEVNGVLKAQGRDLVAVISSENNRKGL